METNKFKEDSHEEELCSLSEIFSSFCSEDDHKELSPLQEIFGAHSSSRPKDVVTQNSEDKRDKKSTGTNKRQRSMEYRVMMEKKRRQLIRDKVDILQEMTPNCRKSDLATKLENIAEYIKSLKYQRDIMSMACTANPVYTSPFYGAQAPAPVCMPQWGYYAPGFPMMPCQNMPFTPQFHQVPFDPV